MYSYDRFLRQSANNEIIVFHSKGNDRDYLGRYHEQGRFTVRLPAGDEYEIFILGFKDSTSYNVLKIPGLTGNAYYKNPFKVNIKFQPSKTFVLEDCNFETARANLSRNLIRCWMNWLHSDQKGR